MKNFGLPLFFFLLNCYFPVHAQKQNIQFGHIGTANGLSQSNVFCIKGDSRGFIWFGTGDGLNKYDGYNFKIFKNNPADPGSISNNYITDIRESRNGDLWIATLGGGVCRYNRNTERFVRYRHDAKNSNSLVNDLVNSIAEDQDGKLWIGTESGLDLFDPVQNKFDHFYAIPKDTNSLSNSYVRYIYQDRGHSIWIGTLAGGVNRYNPATKNFTRFLHDKHNSHSLAGNNVYTMFEDSRSRLWIGTDGEGLDLMNRENGTFDHFRHDGNNPNSLAADAVFAINEDAENNLWIGTENGGLSIFNFDNGSFATYRNDEVDMESISNNSICSIFKDRQNNMWVGNFAGGVDLANRDKTKFTHFKHRVLKNSLSNNHVLSIFEDRKKNVWIGTDGGGLNLFDPVKNSFVHFTHQKNKPQSISGDHVLTVYEDSKGDIWAGTWADGISVYNPAQKTFRYYKHDPAKPGSLNNDNAWKIFEDRDKNIWIGTFGSGLDMLNPDQQSFTHYTKEAGQLLSNNIISIFEDSDGLLCICTDGGGLSLFDKKTKRFTNFLHDDNRNSISNNTLSSILEDEHKNLWIATRRGLNYFDKKTRQFTVYTIAEGLPDNSIFGILEDGKKNLWISTNKGISCFNPATKTFKNYGISDGLQSNEFTEQAFCKSVSGMMYFGGNNGFNQFMPDSIKVVPFDPPLVITNFQVFNNEVPIAANGNDGSPLKTSITETDSITLPYSSSVFSFEFATLNYTAPEKKRYAYMLENFDQDWNEIGTARTATYTNLDPGKYVFRVKGLNNEGGWSAKESSIVIFIKPPFWMTWWFRLAVLAAIAGSVVGFYRFRVNDIKAQRTKLQKQVQQQTEQLILSAEQEHAARTEAENARVETEFANKELKLKNKELEQFAYVASHDLQEPLRTTSGFVELIQHNYRGKLDEKADKYLDFISDASNRMKVLINDLLDFSRIGVNVELKEIDCNQLVKNMLKDIMTAVQESKADIQYATLPVINGYPTEIKLLFQNLVLNAIKFRSKTVPLEIRIHVADKADHWEFSVSDNGIGIDKKNNQRIFDIFQRLHTKKEYPGSGIGLSHCKKIVELHKGKIWLVSELGHGATFHFTITKNMDKG